MNEPSPIAKTPTATTQNAETAPDHDLSDQDLSVAARLTVADIRAARDRIADAVIETVTSHSRTLSQITGANIYLKFENHQFTASFKERGALNALLLMDEGRRAKGVIAASAGNHAQGLSYHATRLGVPATIVMPVTTPVVKVQQTESVGGKVVLFGEKFDDAYTYARQLEQEQGLTFVHPFDDPDVAAGQGTIALEMLEAVPGLDMMVVPIGGGGLMSGMATAALAVKPGIAMIGVEAELYPSMFGAVKGGSGECAGDTLAEGIAVKEPGALTRQWIAERVEDILLVSEPQLERAVSLLLQIEKTVVEGAGAAGLAAVLGNRERFAGKNVGLVLCGGNIDTRLLANVLIRDLARSGRLSRLRITLQDRPGALFKVMRTFDLHQVNIIEIYHQRIFTNLPAKGLITDIECEARDKTQLDALIVSLRQEGYAVHRVEMD